MGVLGFTKTYSNAALEECCKRALATDKHKNLRVKHQNLLVKKFFKGLLITAFFGESKQTN